MNSKQVIGSRIRELREAKKLTQEALALRLGIHSQSVSRWERGANTPLKLTDVEQLCKVLGTTISKLYKGL